MPPSPQHGFASLLPPSPRNTTPRSIERSRAPTQMAALATARPPFSFRRHLPFVLRAPRTPTLHAHRPQAVPLRSVDVSKEDKPLEPPPAAEREEAGERPQLDPRRLEERFAVVNTGVYECRSCGYRYDEAAGDPAYPVPPGLPFAQLPVDWRCPTCGAAQSFFESKSVEIAGFAQNQQFGLGGNSLTAGQKALLIYGGLLLGFLLFLSGYFLQ